MPRTPEFFNATPMRGDRHSSIGQPDLTVYWDIDGTMVYGPPPLVTTLRQHFKQDSGIPTTEFQVHARSKNRLARTVDIISHNLRALKPDALRAIFEMDDYRGQSNRNISMQVLSGREPHLHATTRDRLELIMVEQFFDEMHLNPGGSSAGWKAHVVAENFHQGHSSVLLEDDARAAKAVGEVAAPDYQQVLVYLIQNIATKASVLRFAGIALPPNVILVQSATEAVSRFKKDLEAGVI